VSGEVGERSLVQVKPWLQCGGLKSSGKNETLVDRQVVQRGPYLQCFIITPNTMCAYIFLPTVVAADHLIRSTCR
jgi:hypothetical protein